ncbi:MAG: acetyl-CoA carboxylase biotin carboxyl carrier protein subunit, partial [Syntrophales bacterium]|nr:acetyl-CoA carboxylase biotin carboxyl carrier protein subunit [Syntrophales bacterium]
GTVNEVSVKAGEDVSFGQNLLVLEAMKMLNNVTSEVNGKVSEIYVSPGDKVIVGDPLMFITKE